jgi:23S rRNA (adenine2503-C2)-methyltransferase
MKRDIKSMLPFELEDYFVSIGEKPYRAKQVFSWLHSDIITFSDMTNLSLGLRERLDKEFFISIPRYIEKLVSKSDGTIKYLFHLKDGDAVECVFMEYSHGNTVCISTQVGCRMGCLFCASSLDGYKRNLSASEMIDQILLAKQDSGKRISNVVLMGIGEPLDNFDNVIRFIQLICHPYGMNIGSRHLTVSTCGIIENIDRLSEYDVQLTLAISLHAPDDETRSRLMPVNRKTGVKNLLEASERYFNKTGRRVSFEYAMIDGVNDTPDQAALLSKQLKNTASHLNLILMSNVSESGLRAGDRKSVDLFTDILKSNNINYTVRRSLGADIEAACGQLRRRMLQASE